MKDATRNSKLSSIFAWPLTIMGLGLCFIKDDQISAYLNFDIFATMLKEQAIIRAKKAAKEAAAKNA